MTITNEIVRLHIELPFTESEEIIIDETQILYPIIDGFARCKVSRCPCRGFRGSGKICGCGHTFDQHMTADEELEELEKKHRHPSLIQNQEA